MQLCISIKEKAYITILTPTIENVLYTFILPNINKEAFWGSSSLTIMTM
jgi:hypothetical protein